MDQNVPVAPFFFAPNEASRGSPSNHHQQQPYYPNGHGAPHQQHYVPVQQPQHEPVPAQDNSLAAALARLQASVGTNPLPPPLRIKQEETPAYVPAGHSSHMMAPSSSPVPLPAAAATPMPPTSNAALEIIAELRAEMRRMANRIQALEASTKEAASEAKLALRRPLVDLETDMAALRDASRSRFEAIERHTKALHQSTVALMAKLSEDEQTAEATRERSVAATVSKEEAEHAELRQRQEKRRKQLEEEWYGKAGRPTVKTESTSGGAVEREAESSSSRTDRKRTIDQLSSPTSRPAPLLQSERDSSVARHSLSTSDFTRIPTVPSTRALSLRERSPLRAGPPTGPRASVESTQNPLVKRLRLSESHTSAGGSTTWDADIPLQAAPLPSGEGFEVIVRAMWTLYREKRIEPGALLDSSVVKLQVVALQPDVLVRYKAEKWSQFLIMAQRYVAIVLRLSDKARGTKGGCEMLTLRDLDKPYYAHPATPPPYTQQREAALLLLGNGDEATSTTSTSAAWGRREASSSQQTLASSQQTFASSQQSTSSQATTERGVVHAVPVPPYTLPHVAALPPNLFPQWIRQLEKPDYFFVLVDVLREHAVPPGRSAHVLTTTVYRAVEARMGEETFQRLIRALKGFKTYLGAASRFVKLAWQSKEHAHVLSLLDSDAPFFDEANNEAYFKHVDQWRAKAASRFR